MKKAYAAIQAPWSTHHIDSCIIFDGQYVPVRMMAKMTLVSYNTLVTTWSGFIKRTLRGTGTYKNFVRITDVKKLLKMLDSPYWDNEDKLDSAVKQLSNPTIVDQDDDDDDNSSSSVPHRKRDREEAPEWAKDFLEKIEANVGVQAIQVYMLTTEFKEKTEQLILDQIPKIEDEMRRQMRPEIEKLIRAEIKDTVESKMVEEAKKQCLKRFEIKGAKSVVQTQVQRPPALNAMIRNMLPEHLQKPNQDK